MKPSSTRGSCAMGNYTIKIKVVNAKEALCNYMNYIVTYRSNIFIHFGSDTNTVHDLLMVSIVTFSASLYCNHSEAL